MADAILPNRLSYSHVHLPHSCSHAEAREEYLLSSQLFQQVGSYLALALLTSLYSCMLMSFMATCITGPRLPWAQWVNYTAA